MPIAVWDIYVRSSFAWALHGDVFARRAIPHGRLGTHVGIRPQSVVRPATPRCEQELVVLIPIKKRGVLTVFRLVLDGASHMRRVVAMREHQQTVLLRRKNAEVDRLPVKGKPTTDFNIAITIKEDQR